MDRIALLIEADRLEDLGQWELAATRRLRAALPDSVKRWQWQDVILTRGCHHEHIDVGRQSWCEIKGWAGSPDTSYLRLRIEAAVEHLQRANMSIFGTLHYSPFSDTAVNRTVASATTLIDG